MDTATLLAIIGLSATVILGVYSIHLVFRTQRYPGHITFVKEICIGLFDAFVRNLTDLSILYKNEPVGENLVLLKGYLLNTGTKDISPEMIEERISITLPEGYRWLAVTVVSTSSHVASRAQIDNQREIRFETGLFRRREHISFEAIAEVPESRNAEHSESDPAEVLESAMEFRHRIADTQKIDRQEVQSDRQIRKYKEFLWAMGIQLLLMVIGMCVLVAVVWWKGVPADIHYQLSLEDSQVIEVAVTAHLDGKVDVKGVKTDYIETIPIETFFSERKWQAKCVVSRDSIVVAVMGGFVILLPLGLFVFALRQRRKDASLRRSLGIDSVALPANAGV